MNKILATELFLPLYVSLAENEVRYERLYNNSQRTVTERALLSARTRLAAKKAQGMRLGNRTNLPAAAAKGAEATRRAAENFARNVLPIIREMQKSGLSSYRAIAGALNARGIPTARGGHWHDSTVRNALHYSGT
jgi:hypothetical protein